MNIFSTAFSGILESLIQMTGDWLIAIVLITLSIRVVLFPLSVKQQKAIIISQNLNKVREFLSNKYKNRSDKINESIAKIITQYKVSPFLPLITIVFQMPVLFSFYFSLMNLSTTVGSSLIPWILSVNKPDDLHILPIVAGLFQGLSGFTTENRNILTFLIPICLGLVFLWKAPAALSVYWGVNSLISFVEKKIMSLKSIQRRFLKVISVEEMIKSLG
ncbi:YidC/Oxa1 family membrane protein insertase [Thermincola ferriacetica]|uniref:YidC/Oxa1 family membrane protein insertase n=1 Tax=Thermincola ferriacetica TaxID=281456 RepID=A0A0L6VY76_9FIRM|nr:YidC/Oxa1 family membrane protein insertase [Thermincola ferriacetica]KNZ68205.1 YidC/Oxa1 family membrane protein insertase [Thermincola ferriacetica]